MRIDFLLRKNTFNLKIKRKKERKRYLIRYTEETLERAGLSSVESHQVLEFCRMQVTARIKDAEYRPLCCHGDRCGEPNKTPQCHSMMFLETILSFTRSAGSDLIWPINCH